MTRNLTAKGKTYHPRKKNEKSRDNTPAQNIIIIVIVFTHTHVLLYKYIYDQTQRKHRQQEQQEQQQHHSELLFKCDQR